MSPSSSVPSKSSASSAAVSESHRSEIVHHTIVKYLIFVWVGLIAITLLYRLVILHLSYNRLLAIEQAEKFYSLPKLARVTSAWKRHCLYSPLFGRLHKRNLRLGPVSLGVVPSQPQLILIVAYVAINIVFSVIDLPYGSKSFLPEFRNRTGILAVVNMIPLFLMAGRNNVLVWLLDIPFDSYNLLHRWLGRLVVTEALAHMFIWAVNKVWTKGWTAFRNAASQSQVVLTGTIAICGFAVLLLHSPHCIRSAYYETFLHIHIVMAAMVSTVLWYHLKDFSVAQKLLLVAIVLWACERSLRLARLLWSNARLTHRTLVQIELLAGEAMRIDIHLARPWKFQPGQYIFLYIPSIGLWTNHPFSIAWAEEQPVLERRLPSYHKHNSEISTQEVGSQKGRLVSSTMSVVVRRRAGFTNILWKRVNSSQRRCSVTAFVEGPYGGQDLSSYGTILLFAAGVGITHQISFLHRLAAHTSNKARLTRRIVLVWTVRSVEHYEWARSWIDKTLQADQGETALQISLFITHSVNEKHTMLPREITVSYGRPDIASIITEEQKHQIGVMVVSVCGPGSFSDDVRHAVRERCTESRVDFMDNSFSW